MQRYVLITVNFLCVIFLDCKAEITKYGDIRITIGAGKPKMVTAALDSIQLSIFSHRFMSIAEQMGR